MDTEKYLFSKDIDFSQINIFEFDDITISGIETYIELTRHIQELKQLFDVYRFNLECLLSNYDITSTDRISRKENLKSQQSDFICINALVINYLSAGRAVVDSVDLIVKNTYGEGSDEYTGFRDTILSKEYDNNFTYRLFYHLRNFSQHLHLPVSVNGCICCFDFKQILNTPYYKANKALLNEMEDYIKSASENGTSMLYSFTLSLANYTCAIAKIYKDSLPIIKDRLCEFHDVISTWIKDDPELVQHKDQKYYGYVFYNRSENDIPDIHAFNTRDNSVEMVERFIKEANDFYNTETVKFDNLYKSIQKMKAFDTE